MTPRFAIGCRYPHSGPQPRYYAVDTALRPQYRFERYNTLAEAGEVANWMNDREAGYASLKRFEGGKEWPAFGGRTEPFEIDSGLAPRNGGRWP